MKKIFARLIVMPLVAIIGMILTETAFSQNQAIKNLPSDLNSTGQGPTPQGVYPQGEYKARDVVTMKPPFNTKGSDYPGQEFRAYIDENIVVPTTFTSPTILSSNQNPYTLDENLEVGSTAGNFNVSLTGSATYDVPINLPPGTAGFQPSISVSYNSNAGDGIMGIGWNISGLSAISRVPKTLDFDGIIQGVQFNSMDAFALDGNRLVPDGNGGYRTSVETFTKITILGATYLGPFAFQAETKDGLIIEYGNTVDSKLYLTGDPSYVIASYINKVSDRNGNYYTYTYYNNYVTGEFRLQQIDYTKNDAANIPFYNRVLFVYEQKLDEQICNKYYLGSLQADNVLLREIRVSAEGQMFHKYVFNYSHSVLNDNPEFIYLTDLQEIFTGDVKYNKTIFNYGTGTSVNPGNITCSSDCNDNGTQVSYNFTALPFFGDFNGDGKLETAELGRYPTTNSGFYNYKAYLNNGGGLPIKSIDVLLNVDENYGRQFLVNPSNYYVGGTSDMTGDGKDDAIFCSSHFADDNNNKRTLSIFPLISVPDAQYSIYRNFQKLSEITIPGLFLDEIIQTDLMDFDGDGLSDLFVRTNNTVRIYYSNYNQALHEAHPIAEGYVITLNSNFGSILDITFLDYNGDRKMDFIVTFSNNGNKNSLLYIGNITRGSFNEQTIYNSSSDLGHEGTFTSKLYVGDFNGDGNSDLFIPEHNVFQFSRGMGGLFDYKVSGFNDVHDNSTIAMDPYSNYYIGDYNGDGKADIAFFSYTTAGNAGLRLGYFGIYYNENFSKQKFTFSENTKHNNGCYMHTNGDNHWRRLLYGFPVDIDGDGVTEIKFSRYCNDRTITNNGFDVYDPVYPLHTKEDVLNGSNFFCNKITKIADGMNVQTAINYKVGGFGITQSNHTVSSAPTECTYPIISSFFPMTVVESVSESTGIGHNTIKTDYRFSDPQTHLRGKGFLGFKSVMECHEIGTHYDGSYANSTVPFVDYGTFAITTTNFDYNQTDNPYNYPSLMSKNLDYLVTTCPYSSGIPIGGDLYSISKSQYTNLFYKYGPLNDHFFPFIKEETIINYYYDNITVNGIHQSQDDKTTTGKSTQTTTSYNYPEETNIDSDGNVTSISSDNGINTTLTVFEDYEIKGSWCRNKPKKQTVTISRSGSSTDPPHTTSVNYTWDAATGRLTKQISTPGIGDGNAASPFSDLSNEINYVYFPSGNTRMVITKAKTGTHIDNLSTVTMGYDDKFRFVTQQTDALNHKVEATYEPKYGNILTSKDPNGLITTYTYDGLGRNKEITTPLGQKVNNSIWWTQGTETGNNENCLFYTKSNISTSGSQTNPTYEFFDCLGRSVGTWETGHNIKTTTYYNNYGQTVQSRQPGPNTNRLYSHITYDVFGRATITGTYIASATTDPTSLSPPSTSETAVSQITHSFDLSETDKFTVIATDKNSRMVSKTFDKGGALIKSTDVSNSGNTNPVIVEYKYNCSNQPITITAAGTTTNITYDKYGRQYTLVDPDAGTSTFKYNSLNQIVEQTDGIGNKYELVYDKIGRVIQKKETPDGSTTVNTYNYTYDTEPNGKGMLASMSGGPDNMTTSYKYDNFSRNYEIKESFDGHDFITAYGYDDHSRVSQITYPSGYIVKQLYNNGTDDLIKITDAGNNTIWQLDEMNQAGVITKSKLGNNLQFSKERTFTPLGLPQDVIFSASFGQNSFTNMWTYDFNPVTGNMMSRNNTLTQNGVPSRNFTETFGYYVNDRLKTVSANCNTAVAINMNYHDNGNIESKTDATGQEQNYTYETTHPHAVQKISPLNETVNPLQKIEYTPFNKISQIMEGDKDSQIPPDIDLNGNFTQLNYTYGLDNERKKMTEVKTVAGVAGPTRTKYYSINYEKETYNGITKEINYIFAPDGLAAIYESNTQKLYYVVSDAQGSINMIVNGDNGTIEADMGYDAWGRRRNAQDWSYNNITSSSVTERGYTMHEMLDNFNLINMNGRAYDPLVGQFLSPDPFVSHPENPQGYNRYAYCLNNPLKYTDPSGYFDWQWFIDQNISSSAIDYKGYMYYDRYYETDYSRQMQQSMNRITAYRNWKQKQDLFAQNYKGIFTNKGILLPEVEIMDVITRGWQNVKNVLDQLDIMGIRSYEKNSSQNLGINHLVLKFDYVGPKHTNEFDGFWGQVKFYVFGGDIGKARYNSNGNLIGSPFNKGYPPCPAFKGGKLFIKGFGIVDKVLFHKTIKPNILKNAGNFMKIVGKNPDVIVKDGEIFLKGVGDFNGNLYPTGLSVYDFLMF